MEPATGMAALAGARLAPPLIPTVPECWLPSLLHSQASSHSMEDHHLGAYGTAHQSESPGEAWGESGNEELDRTLRIYRSLKTGVGRQSPAESNASLRAQQVQHARAGVSV